MDKKAKIAELCDKSSKNDSFTEDVLEMVGGNETLIDAVLLALEFNDKEINKYIGGENDQK